MNLVQHDKSTPFETKSRYCRAARQGLPCYAVVPNLIKPAELNGFKCRATAVLKSNLIQFNLVRHGSSATFGSYYKQLFSGKSAGKH